MASIKLKGDTSGEVTISAPAVAGTTTLELPATSSTLATQNALGVRNLIINGDMRIAQRGTSATVSGTTFVYRTVDRVLFRANGVGAFTESQDTDVPSGQGFSKSVKYLCTTSASPSTSGWLQFNYRMEGQNLQHLNYGTSEAKKLTASFWVKSNKTGTYITRLFSYDTTRSIQKAITINSADTWEKKIITFDGDTVSSLDNDNNFSLSFDMWLSAGTDYQSGTLATTWSSYSNPNTAVGQVNLADAVNNYINITGLQLEVGDTATPFEHRPYDMELQRCMRYYEKNILQIIGGRATSTTNIQWISAKWTVEKRANPTIVFYGNSTANSVRSSGGATVTLNSPSIGSQTKGTDYVNVSSGLTSGEFYQAGYTADSEL